MAKQNVFQKFPRTFWIANIMELFERWGWYGFYMLLANYLTESTDIGALGFSQGEKGMILGVGTMVLYFLPIITGAIADRYGYKKVLVISFIIYIAGFVAMPFFKSFASVFSAYLFLAIGGALFKPIVSATVAKTTDETTSSLGFGIFYLMVNIGAFVGPLVTLAFKKISYDFVFFMSAAIIGLNFIWLLFYKEPDRKDSNEPLGKSIRKIFMNIGTVLSDFKFVVFLIIVAGFWTMYYQLFFSLTVYINQWVDTSLLYNTVNNIWPWLISKIGSAEGTIDAEYITNVDAMFIIIFQILVSYLVMKLRPLQSMMGGFLVSSIGMGLALSTQNSLFLIVAILIFGLGEMSGSPKITEYIGRIAPKDKVALYIGYSFLPVALGSFLAGIISGPVYAKLSDKINLLYKEMSSQGFTMPELSGSFTKNDAMAFASEKLSMTEHQITQLLWENHNPDQIWMVVFGVGFITTIFLWLYDKFMIKENV